MVSPRHPVILKQKKALAPNTLELTYVREDEAVISYLPGQFFSLDFPHQGEEKTRSYSAAGRVPDLKNNREFRFAITAVPNGAASDYFFNATPGDRAKMSGPFGALILPPVDPHRYLLIGTGTGVAPYRAMLPEIERRLRANTALRVELVMGVRNPQELIYGEEFVEAATRHMGFRFHACYSRQMPATPQAHEQAGRVQVLFETLEPNPEQDMVYICGNPDMVEEAGSWFLARDFSPRRVKREKYKFSTL
ncbi:ferredoxin--NADP reductase [Sedimenticola sp.]|uniref:ferredoxin--NADP reductase n=1 Tax=Sedimenticola sp. TaxID=1940285 RepID=UPI003D1085EB